MKRYLGDGVYAEWASDSLMLTTENGVSITNTILLEPEVWQALIEFVTKDIKRTNQP